MKRFSVLGIVCLLAFAGCKRNSNPPEVTFGAVTCAVCERMITDPSLAAVARSNDGKVKTFDTAMCLFQGVPDSTEWNVWFHDHDGDSWIEGQKAVFVIQRSDIGGPVRAVNAFVDRKHADDFYQRTPGRNEIAEGYNLVRSVVTQ